MGEEAQPVTADGEPKWVEIQKKTFTKWMNNHLRKKGYAPVASVKDDFEDGIKLMQLIAALYDKPIPKHNPNPKMRPHKLDNLVKALDMLDQAEIKTNFLKTTHLIDKDLKMILGMVWAIILDYAIKGISVEELTAKEGLLLWCRKKTAGYRDIDPPGIKNFKNDWKNGLAFCALIHRHRPDLLNYDSLDGKNAAENLELAFSIAEQKLGIPRLLDIEDLKGTPDEKSVMTYVSEYFHRFASHEQKETSARRCAKFLKFIRDMKTRQDEYERRARELLNWSATTGTRFEETKWGETLGEAQQHHQDLRKFVVEERPKHEGEKLDLETLFAEIQTELKVNSRAAYTPPEGLTPDDIQAAFDGLNKKQKAYAREVRDNRFRFVQKADTTLSDDKKKEIDESFTHFDSNKSNSLDKNEFKAALSAMSVFFSSDAEFDQTFAHVSGGATSVSKEQYIHYVEAKYKDIDTPEQIKESFRAVADGNAVITPEQLNVRPLTSEDVAFLQENMPAAQGGLDYSAFVDANFTSS
jgi:actinin alpha